MLKSDDRPVFNFFCLCLSFPFGKASKMSPKRRLLLASAVFSFMTLAVARGEDDYAGKPLMSLIKSDRITDNEVLNMIDDGADLQTEAPGQYPLPLMYFASRGNSVVVEALLKKGVDVNAASANGITPLICAAQRGNDEIVQMLIASQADINHVDSHKRSAISHAATNGHPETVEILAKAGGNPDDKYVGGYTDLMLAAIQGEIGAAEKAMADGGDINAATKNPPGYTALHLAVQFNKPEMLNWLLGKKPDLEPKSFNGTPLGMAQKMKNTDLAEQLIAAGAKE
jgi:ankyrin repeat protein